MLRWVHVWRVQRFRPPLIDLTPELGWVLKRAFAPPAEMTQRINSARALELAMALDLSARIASRADPELLARELGAKGARELVRTRLSAIAAHRAVESALDHTGRIAAELGIELIVVKHAALALGGYITEGSREACDLDVLVAPEHAQALQRALVSSGFSESGFSGQPHHLPSLASANGEVVEIHTSLPGIDVDARAIIAGGLAERCELAFGTCWIPRRDFLLAHAIVHGYVQHGGRPEDYPLARMLADVSDLMDGSVNPQRAHEHVRATMSLGEVRAVFELAEGLTSGALVDLGSDAGEVLRHVVACASDGDYRRVLQLRRLERLVSPAQWSGMLRRLFVPTRAELEVEHGPIASEAAYFVLSRLHPFRRLGTFAGALVAHARLRRRSPRERLQ